MGANPDPTDGSPLPYVLHPRAQGGWWVMRTPDDTAGDHAGYVDGYVECLVAGAWRAVSWDRETTAVAPTLHSAADRLIALRWDPAVLTPDDDTSPGDGPTAANPGTLDHYLSADLTPWCGAGPDGTGSTLCTPVAGNVTCPACRKLLDTHPDEVADPDGAHLLGIVLALADTYPVSMGECTLCARRAPGAAVTLTLGDHDAACPWRLARSYSTDLAAARQQ